MKKSACLYSLIGAPAYERDSARQVVRAGLHDRVDDTAGGLTELDVDTAGLDLHFFEEVVGHAGPERSVH